MNLKRSIAVLAALCVLAAPAAFAATSTPGGATAPAQAAATTTTPKAQTAAAARHQRIHHRAYVRHMRLTHRLAHLRHTRVARGHAHKARFASLDWLQRKNAKLRIHIRRIVRANHQYRAALRAVSYGTLHAIASCESHNNPRAIGGGGAYRGLFQMTFHIWGAVGGHGDPAAASTKEQYLRAALVYRRYGSGQWPVCGR